MLYFLNFRPHCDKLQNAQSGTTVHAPLLTKSVSCGAELPVLHFRARPKSMSLAVAPPSSSLKRTRKGQNTDNVRHVSAPLSRTIVAFYVLRPLFKRDDTNSGSSLPDAKCPVAQAGQAPAANLAGSDSGVSVS